MFSEKTPDKTLSIFLALSAGVWGALLVAFKIH